MTKSDIEIARESTLQPIAAVAEKLAIPADSLVHYGPHKAKINLDFLATQKDKPRGKLILVTAMSPTPAGEGKTTVAIGLSDAINALGLPSAFCLR